MVMGGALVVFDLDHPDPEVLHGPKPYTERNHDLQHDACGGLDVLVNNAGVSLERSADVRDVPSAVPVDVLRRTDETNVFGAALR
jgi:NAD(P)-dependent dehydrogenase (short-subunit alcohol dehydrogenase family)